MTSEVTDRAVFLPQLNIHPGNIAAPDIIEKIGQVDIVLLFDILLHRVTPDWDGILDLYAPLCDHFLIFNLQYIETDHSVRLLDLGTQEYFNTIPHNPDEPNYRELVAHPNDIHQTLNRPWKDVHHIWQWGITDLDLVSKMASLGCDLLHSLDGGSFGAATRFRRKGFLFSKRSPT